jgi:ATP-dependent RNA helicase DDX10/DBP4
MGFNQSIRSILSHLPPPSRRQTLLFSATQSARVASLAQISLRDPQHVSVGDSAGDRLVRSVGEGEEEEEEREEERVERRVGTPKGLEQWFVKVKLEDKLETLWGFVKTHLKSKIIVFLSACKQVS